MESVIYFLSPYEFSGVQQITKWSPIRFPEGSLHRWHDGVAHSKWNQCVNLFGESEVVALDISEAFDWFGIVTKLILHGVGDSFARWISNFCCDHSIRVALDGFISNEFSINGGVPQGSIEGKPSFLFSSMTFCHRPLTLSIPLQTAVTFVIHIALESAQILWRLRIQGGICMTQSPMT